MPKIKTKTRTRTRARTRTTIPSPAILLLILGLLHAGILVESFSSSLTTQPTKTKTSISISSIISHQSTIQRPPSIKYTTASTTTASTTTASTALRVSTGVAEETPEVSSSDDEDDNDEDEDGGDTSGLPKFGRDGLWHITNEAEYR